MNEISPNDRLSTGSEELAEKLTPEELHDIFVAGLVREMLDCSDRQEIARISAQIIIANRGAEPTPIQLQIAMQMHHDHEDADASSVD